MPRRTINSIEDGLQHSENVINNILEKMQSFDVNHFGSFRDKVNYFSKELSCYLFFNKTIEEIKLETDELEKILNDISQFIAKIGALYVKITDFDGDGRPILDITKAQFEKINGKYVLVLDNVLDYDDINAIKDKIDSFSDSIKIGDTSGAVTIAIESIFGIIQYSLTIYSEIKTMNIGTVFNDIFATLKNYPKIVSENFMFKTVPAMASSLVFSGIMLFIWIGINKIPNTDIRETFDKLLKNEFVKTQISNTVNLIVRAIQGENLTNVKICGCIPLCCKGDIELQKVNDKLQDDLDTLISMTEKV